MKAAEGSSQSLHTQCNQVHALDPEVTAAAVAAHNEHYVGVRVLELLQGQESLDEAQLLSMK